MSRARGCVPRSPRGDVTPPTKRSRTPSSRHACSRQARVMARARPRCSRGCAPRPGANSPAATSAGDARYRWTRKRSSALPGAGVAPAPEQELIDREGDAEIDRAAHAVLERLSDRQREIVALHARGSKRPQIAVHLGLTPRTVKRQLERIMTVGRAELVHLAGHGCEPGEPLVARLAFGLASPHEAGQAQIHLAGCAAVRAALRAPRRMARAGRRAGPRPRGRTRPSRPRRLDAAARQRERPRASSNTRAPSTRARSIRRRSPGRVQAPPSPRSPAAWPSAAAPRTA